MKIKLEYKQGDVLGVDDECSSENRIGIGAYTDHSGSIVILNKQELTQLRDHLNKLLEEE